ncbi:hypothetical protein [Gallaecimonas sp. GXIMD1310]|uniref:hypothetical protein n=1 Tax=Gallaecimonas sp. GXIMD1310 TaxID=3131926 RepID=UPI0032462B5F
MTGKFKIIIFLAIAIVALAIVLTPQLQSFFSNHYTHWQIDKIKANKVDVVCSHGKCEVTAVKDNTAFRFTFQGIDHLSKRVATLNQVMAGWPNTKDQCLSFSSKNEIAICSIIEGEG